MALQWWSRDLSKEEREAWGKVFKETAAKQERVVIDLRFLEEFGTDAGLLLSFLVFWSDKGHDSDGWIYETADGIRGRVKLKTRRQVDRARRTLRDASVLEEKLKVREGWRRNRWGDEMWTKVGNPAQVTHYRVDMIALALRLGLTRFDEDQKKWVYAANGEG